MPVSPTRNAQTFRFLDLPVELQLQIVLFIDDIATIRSFLSVPEVLTNIRSEFRIVTNRIDTGFWYFEGIDSQIPVLRHVGHLVSDLAKSGTQTIYIVDTYRVQEAPDFTLKVLEILKNRYTFVSVSGIRRVIARLIPPPPDQFDSCYKAVEETKCRSSGLFGISSSQLDLRPYLLTVPPWNMTTANLSSMSIRKVTRQQIEDPRQVRFEGDVAMFRLELSFTHHGEKDHKKMLWRLKKVIESAQNVFITPTGLTNEENGRDTTEHLHKRYANQEKEVAVLKKLNDLSTVVDELHLRKFGGTFVAEYCFQFSNIKLSMPTIPDAFVKISTLMRYEIKNGLPSEMDPVIKNIVAPGVKVFDLEAYNVMPMLENLDMPDLKRVVLLGTPFSKLEVQADYYRKSEERFKVLSKLVETAGFLDTDRTSLYILLLLQPSAIAAMKNLKVSDTCASEPFIPSWTIPVLLPNLNEVCCHCSFAEGEVIGVPSMVSTPKLEKLCLHLSSFVVDLKPLARRFGMIKDLAISSRADSACTEALNSASYCPLSFPNLEKLSLCRSDWLTLFKDISFPKLTTVSLNMLIQCGVSKFEMDMPKLEELNLFVDLDLDAPLDETNSLVTLEIGPLKNLKNILIDGSCSVLHLVDCPKIETLKIVPYELPDDFIHSISSTTHLKKLKELEYVSIDGKPKHFFDVPKSANVIVSPPPDRSDCAMA